MRFNLRYVIADRDRHGNERIYLRVPGCGKVRLQGQPGTAEFAESYSSAILKAQPKPTGGPGSLRSLCLDYYKTQTYKDLDPRTRHVRRLVLERVCGRVGKDGIDDGARQWRDLTAEIVETMRDAPEGPEAGNAIVKALRQVFKAMKKPNPAADVEYRKPGHPGGFHTWTVAEVEQFEARHALGTRPRLALALLLYTGVRRSDLVRLGPPMARDGLLRFTEFKGRNRAPKEREVPILPELQRAIAATTCGARAYLVTEFGKPFSAAGFGNWFRERCNEAGLEHCSAHGVRKAGATIAAENGATAHQLKAMFGWRTLKEAERYTKAADEKRLARQSMHLLVPREAEIVPLRSRKSPTGKKRK
jgi:integrase